LIRKKAGSEADLRRLPGWVRGVTGKARELAEKRNAPLYLVGGAVRDLLLRRPVVDVDLAIEGDAVGFGKALAPMVGARASAHERFGTVVLEFPGGARLDVAATRKETYPSSGALPVVARAGLEEDLARRDFTINAMAIRLAPGPPAFLDPFGGRKDLRARTVRMLHEESPRDDPTRAFRAARYANRLGFSVEPGTVSWIRSAIRGKAFDAVSGDRMRREIRLLFSEENRARAAGLLSRLGVDRSVDPSLSSSLHVRRSLARAERIASRHPGKTGWFLYLLVWAGEVSDKAAARIARRLALTREDLSRVLRWPSVLERLRRDSGSIGPSMARAERLSAEEFAAAASLLPPPAGKRIELLLRSLDTSLSISGRDLLAAGVPAGPRIGKALEATLDALREGRISRKNELGFAIRAASGQAP
jgi:tRNA nucleotidyltransferase (CCA-adding enzyme)